MKTNTMMRLASVLLVAVLLSTCAIAGTYAKYVTTVESTASAKVAVWKVSAEGTSDEAVTINLWETLYDTKGDGTATESDVAAQRLAPGTKGSFTIDVKNESEVNVAYTAVLGEENYPITFTFANESNKGNLGMTDETNSGVITVNWEWPFESEGADADDVDMALQGTEVTITVTITFVQVD